MAGMPPGYNPLQPYYLPQDLINQLSPQQAQQQILQGTLPTQQMGYQNLNDALAAAGISGGAAVGLNQQMAAGNAGQIAGALAGPEMQSLGMLLNAGEFNANAGNQAGQELAQMLYGGWGQELSQFGNLNSQGLSGGQSLGPGIQQNYGQYGQNPGYQQLGQALGQYGQNPGSGISQPSGNWGDNYG